MHVDQAMTEYERLKAESKLIRENPYQAFLKFLEFPDVAREYLGALAHNPYFCLRPEDIEGISDERAVEKARYYFAGLTLEKAVTRG